MKNTLLIFSLILVTFACGTADQKKVESLENEVMAIHDEVMPKMGEIMNLKDELASNLKKIDSTSADYASVKQVTDSLSYLLTASDNSMMDWMDEYNADTLKSITPAESEKYLLDQKSKIAQIKENTVKNIDAVKKYLNK